MADTTPYPLSLSLSLLSDAIADRVSFAPLAAQIFGGEGSDGESDSGVEVEDPVLELGGGAEDSEEYSEEDASGEEGESESSEENDEEAEGGRRGKRVAAAKDGDVVGSRARRREAGTLLEKMERQSKFLEMKLKAEAGEDDSGDEEEEEGAAGADERGWGRNRKAYYQQGDAELDGEEEALEREEAEALRLQRQGAERLAASDFDLDLDGEGDEEPSAATPADLVALSAEERDELAGRDAPELTALLGELQESMSEVRNVVGPLLQQVREGELATERGLGFLEAKHLLLLAYCGHIVHYLRVKAEGGTVQGHPVVAQLVQLRAYLEKVRPIDKKLQHQVERLLRASSGRSGAGAGTGRGGGLGGDGDALRHRPNPGALVAKEGAAPGGSSDSEGSEEEGAAGGGRGVYKPPKIAPMAFGADDAGRGEGAGGLSKEAQRRARRGEYMRELAQELRGAPEEESLLPVGMRAGLAQRERERWRKRAAQEEDIFRRVDLSKSEKKRSRAAERAGLSGAALLDDLGEDIADIVAGVEAPRGGGGVGELWRSGAASGASRKRRGGSGDGDGPARESLGDRRARFDSARASRAVKGGGLGHERGQGRAERRGEEDEFYRGAKEASQVKKKAKKSKYAAPESHPPMAEAEAAGKRNISYEIEKNRGLTPHRNKALKNPRKKHRIKYGQAVVRRKGQVQEVRAQKEAYGGEATGVRGKLARSRKL